ncbi:hypothetical protein KKG51_03040, partial [Patescibacteria group bacterium]|nr:hypothetical protein [Patescibacteria group bacterium]
MSKIKKFWKANQLAVLTGILVLLVIAFPAGTFLKAQIVPPPEPSTCTDSDEGRNYYATGSVSNCSADGICTLPIADSCIEGFTLEEGYCENGNMLFEKYTCPNGCQDGACIKETNYLTVYGKLLDRKTGEPLANATIFTDSISGRSVNPIYTDEGGYFSYRYSEEPSLMHVLPACNNQMLIIFDKTFSGEYTAFYDDKSCESIRKTFDSVNGILNLGDVYINQVVGLRLYSDVPVSFTLTSTVSMNCDAQFGGGNSRFKNEHFVSLIAVPGGFGQLSLETSDGKKIESDWMSLPETKACEAISAYYANGEFGLNLCGNAVCSLGETHQTCPQDCINYACVDSDGGKDYYKKGISSDYGTPGPVEDVCINKNELTEYSCTGTATVKDTEEVIVLKKETYYCPNGCRNGACVQGVQSSITVLSPNGGEEWKTGETHRIRWESKGIDSVDIYIYDPSIFGSGSTNHIAPANMPISATLGYYDWTIPPLRNLPPLSSQLPGGGDNYKIRIDDVSSDVNDHSDNFFSITEAELIPEPVPPVPVVPAEEPIPVPCPDLDKRDLKSISLSPVDAGLTYIVQKYSDSIDPGINHSFEKAIQNGSQVIHTDDGGSIVFRINKYDRSSHAEKMFDIINTRHTRKVLFNDSSIGEETFCHTSPDFYKRNQKYYHICGFRFGEIYVDAQTETLKDSHNLAVEFLGKIYDKILDLCESQFFCTDADGGRNYYEKGTTRGSNMEGTDFCGIRTVPEFSKPTVIYSCPKMEWESGQKCTLYEYACGTSPEFDPSHAVRWEHECPNGCKNGACMGERGKVYVITTLKEKAVDIEEAIAEAFTDEDIQRIINERVLARMTDIKRMIDQIVEKSVNMVLERIAVIFDKMTEKVAIALSEKVAEITEFATFADEEIKNEILRQKDRELVVVDEVAEAAQNLDENLREDVEESLEEFAGYSWSSETSQKLEKEAQALRDLIAKGTDADVRKQVQALKKKIKEKKKDENTRLFAEGKIAFLDAGEGWYAKYAMAAKREGFIKGEGGKGIEMSPGKELIGAEYVEMIARTIDAEDKSCAKPLKPVEGELEWVIDSACGL